MPRTRSQMKSEGFRRTIVKKNSVTKIENFEKVEEEMITSSGKFGRCNVSKGILCPQR